MSAAVISCIAFACVLGGALLGMFLRVSLPEHHLSTDSKDFVKLGTGLIATMAALVLGLLIASAKNSYDIEKRIDAGVRQYHRARPPHVQLWTGDEGGP